MAIGFNPGAGKGRFVSSKSKVRIVGLKRLKNEFSKMGSKSDSLMTKEIHRAAERIAERANRDVPIDTGRLNRSINVKKWTGMASVRVDATYARYVEEGTYKMKAQPYIYKHIKPSIDQMTKNIKRLL